MCTWAGMSRMCSAAQVTAAAAALALAGARPSELEAGGESSDSPCRGAPGGPDSAASVATRREGVEGPAMVRQAGGDAAGVRELFAVPEA